MTAHPTSKQFNQNVKNALANKNLQVALNLPGGGLAARRTAASDKLPEFEKLCDAARDVRAHALANIDQYLEIYETNAITAGSKVHWAETADQACDIILKICAEASVDDRKAVVNKGKSMVSEEIGLNAVLEKNGHTVVETDLGEYIIQLRGEAPSHVIAPAAHVTKAEVEDEFRRKHAHLDADRQFPDPQSLVREARKVLREKYFDAAVGITGANMLIAETGQSVIVTNEGNGDLTQSLSRIHIVIASIDKITPTLDDASTIIRVLARSATGQQITAYTTFSKGPRRDGDPDGPEEYHVVILDNGRSQMIGGAFHDMLRCIRCGACMNHCPVYKAVGGHSYGWVYVGPMGAVLTPRFVGLEEGSNLPNASTFCGRCEAVCPVRIPLPKLMRRHRIEAHEKGLTRPVERYALGIWAFFAKRPRLYHFGTFVGMSLMTLIGRKKGRFAKLPLASGWTKHRDFTAPQGGTFQAQYAKKMRAKKK